MFADIETTFQIAVTYNKESGNYFIDFWQDGKYIVSCKVSYNVANGIARDLGIKILQ